MKNIKITKSCSGAHFAFRQGETREVEDRLADDLISAGYAQDVTPGRPEKTETVSDEQVENKVTPPAKKPTTARKSRAKKDADSNADA